MNPAQSALLQAGLVVAARWRYYHERRQKIKSSKFHTPGPGRVIASFDAVDYGDEEFDPAAPLGKGIFDQFIFKGQNKDEDFED